LCTIGKNKKEDYIYLQVSFSEKGIVKGLEARWNNDKKKWYVNDTPFNKERFAKWNK
jgi:hypothetical protein